VKKLIILFTLIFALAVIWGCDESSESSPTGPTIQDTEYTQLDTVRTQVKDYGKGTGTLTWTNDRTWILDGFVFVNDGQVLTIQAGTVVKGRSGQGANASALIVARGGKLIAEGTATSPIIFTAESDDLSSALHGVRGLWGGLIVLGKARINTAAGEGQIEGIPEDEPRGAYGGNDDADDSGIIKYVSIRHGGTEIGQANEINGLTMGAVGNGTTIDYVEVVYNKDDGFEWFGGTVNCSHLIGAYNGDDTFDYDEGWRGKGQYWLSLQAADAGDRAAEHDGGTDPEDGTPYAIPTISNATYIGSGANSANADNQTFKIRDNAGAKYYNSIFQDFTKRAMDIEDLASGEDSRARLDAGDIDFRNNIWFSFGGGNTAADMCAHDYEEVLFTDVNRKNWIVDAQITNLARLAGFDPRPTAPQATGDVHSINDAYFDQTNYVGAFDPNGNLWLAGWSYLSEYNIAVQ
jgi:hypothetical protein